VKFKSKFIQIILVGVALLYSSSTFASNLPSIAGEPPREAFTFLKKEIIYKVCAENRSEANIKPDCRTIKTGAAASGVLLRHYQSPSTNEKVSLILTAGHFCRDPAPLLPREFNSPSGPKVLSAKVYWRYTAFDYLGKKYIVNKAIAKTGTTDLCLLESQYIDRKPIQISSSGLNYGDKVLSVGTPYALFMPPSIILDEGFYIGSGGDNGPMIISDMVIGPGSSGSMVIQKQTLGWKLVGMIHAVVLIDKPPVGKKGLVAEPLLALGATLKQIKDFINYAEESYINGD
jgi:hypothetical protein